MRHAISLFSTGWQDGQDGFGVVVVRGRPVILLSCYPVILSDLSRDVPVLGFGMGREWWLFMCLMGSRPNRARRR
jgi:hypothetical protein